MLVLTVQRASDQLTSKSTELAKGCTLLLVTLYNLQSQLFLSIIQNFNVPKRKLVSRFVVCNACSREV
jgi:hypothetical protein